MKWLLVLLIPTLLLGCVCRDGGNSYQAYGWTSSSYRACFMGCCKEGNAHKCRCSAACPCWKRHD